MQPEKGCSMYEIVPESPHFMVVAGFVSVNRS